MRCTDSAYSMGLVLSGIDMNVASASSFLAGMSAVSQGNATGIQMNQDTNWTNLVSVISATQQILSLGDCALMETKWNDEEDEALRRLPWRARVVYLQGIRRFMDYQTGWAGKTRVLSYRFFSELLECSEHTTAPDPEVTKDGLRAIFKMLERVGLVEWPRGTSQQRGVFFRCLLADTDDSVQKQDAPKTHPRRTQQDAPANVSNDAACSEEDAPKTHPCCNCEDAPPPVSGIRKEGTIVPLSEPASPKPDCSASDDGTNLVLLPSVLPCPHLEIIALYLDALPELPGVIPSRWAGSTGSTHLQARWREDKRHQSLDFWARFFATVRTNPHWLGQNDRAWRADLRWLVKRENFDKVLLRLLETQSGTVRHA